MSTNITIAKNILEPMFSHSCRYCLGRMTYAPYEFSLAFNACFDELSDTCLKWILDDINRCTNFGMDIDKEMWMEIKQRIEEKLEISEVSE
jgi:hypothetical protein